MTAAGLTALTDASGAYILNNVPGGSIAIVASATGFSPATETVTVTTGTTVQAPTMTLTSNLGNVTGKVLDIQNSPIANATVTFGGGTATTDSTGSFSFSNIPAGTIQLVASAAGFQSATQNVTVAGGSTATANFMLAVATNAPGIVTGTVTNIRTQAVIPNAIVTWNTTSVRSNSSGVYSIPNVAGGNQTVTAAVTGYLPVSSAVNVNGETSTLNFQLSTAGIINVTVVNSGTSVSGAQVTLSGGQISTSLTGTTNVFRHIFQRLDTDWELHNHQRYRNCDCHSYQWSDDLHHNRPELRPDHWNDHRGCYKYFRNCFVWSNSFQRQH